MQTLDDDLIKKPNADVTYYLGYSFGTTARVFGVLMAIIGVILFSLFSVGGVFVGSVFMFPGVFLLTANYGVDIDYTNGFFREYTKKYGIKGGKWKHIGNYPYLTVLTANINYGYRQMITSFITANGNNVSDKAYGVYLLSKTDHNRILIKRVKGSFKDAVEEAKKISQKTNKDRVKFEPKRISRRYN